MLYFSMKKMLLLGFIIFISATANSADKYAVYVDTANMVLIPAGEFLMGSDKCEVEKPPHKVYLDAYYIDKYEVTNGAYKVFLDAGYNNSAYWTIAGWEWKKNNNVTKPSYWNNPTFGYNATNRLKLPVVGVSWYEAYAYANWAGKRLPTEAEWEKACRAGSTGKYCFGNNQSKLGDYAWYYWNLNGKRTRPVGQKKPNAWSIYDMHGNVLEWCADWYDDNYYKNSPNKNPQGPDSGKCHVARGGAWGYGYTDFFTSTNRDWAGFGSDSGGYDVGFRCACNYVRCWQD